MKIRIFKNEDGSRNLLVSAGRHLKPAIVLRNGVKKAALRETVEAAIREVSDKIGPQPSLPGS